MHEEVDIIVPIEDETTQEKIDDVWLITFHRIDDLHNDYFEQFRESICYLKKHKLLQYDKKAKVLFVGKEGDSLVGNECVLSRDKKMSIDKTTHFVPYGLKNLVKITGCMERKKHLEE